MKDLVAVLTLAVLASCASALPPSGQKSPDMSSSSSSSSVSLFDRVVDAPDREEADRLLDEGRRAKQFLAFLAVTEGMTVGELMAGRGYTAELLARAVGDRGVVYAQNNNFVLQRFAERPWSERLRKPVMRNVVRIDRELEDPFPPEVKGSLDLVVMNLFYHDTVWQEVDRGAMNRAIFTALRPGGRFVIVDHSAAAGRGLEDVKTLHRIEERAVIEEVLAAGFERGREGSFLRNGGDTRDWNAAPSAAADKRGTSDRFVLEFVKPLAGEGGGP